MENQPSSKKKFDPVHLITQALNVLKHSRLMLLMVALGILAGACYYVYSRPLYMARSQVYLRAYGASLKDSRVDELRMSGSALNRFFLTNLVGARNSMRAAKKLGLVGPGATAEDVVDHVPSIRYNIIDTNNIEVIVVAYEKDVVRKFAETLVDEYRASQEEDWKTFRDEALERYTRDVARLEAEIEQSRKSILDQERESNLTEVTIAQSNLTNVMAELMASREQLTRLKMLQTSLADQASNTVGNESDTEIEEAIRTLSAISRFEEETEVEVGSIVRLPTAGARPTVSQGKALPSTDVIVQPAMVEGVQTWEQLDKERRLLQDEIRKKSETFLPDHEVMRGLRERYEEVEQKLLAERDMAEKRLELQIAKVIEKEKTLESRVPEYYDATEKLDKAAYAHANLADSQAIWDRARDQLADKLAAITFAEDRDWLDLQFKGHVFLRDDIPVSPNKMKLLMVTVLISFAGAFGLPMALNMMSTSVSSVPSLEEYTGLRGIGMVPLAKQELLEDIHRSPAQGATTPNFLLETIRVIRSNICLYPGRNGNSQVVMVTSARPQEGKTSQAANLAWAFQSMGEKTILLDCDLRRGRVHGFIGLDNSKGMTALLPGAASLDEVIIRTGDLSSSFDAVPRGPIVAGTTEILCQKRFDDIIAVLRKHYDRIILDTPPVLGLSETSSLQRLADGVVLVVRAEKTSRKDVMDAVRILSTAGAHFFGFVLNAVDLSKASNYYSYYYYSAAYYDDLDFPDDQKPAGLHRPRPDHIAPDAQPTYSPSPVSGSR